LILSLSSCSNTFELLLIFFWDHVLPHMCVASLEIGELELSVQCQVQVGLLRILLRTDEPREAFPS
jgi:hypothetical protein